MNILANIIIHPDGMTTYTDSGFPEHYKAIAWTLVILIDAVADLAVLAICFALLKEFKRLISYKFLIYFPLVVIGGLVIDMWEQIFSGGIKYLYFSVSL